MTKTAIREAFEHLRPAEELHVAEEAARSRSEADWLVGMNATRAASIRLRAAFDGAVSLGRVQTPTLALVARREEEIRNFVPEPYWLVEKNFEAPGERRYRPPTWAERLRRGGGAGDRRRRPRPGGRDHEARESEQREQPQLLYDLTSLQRHANSLYGFSARRTLAAPSGSTRTTRRYLPAYELTLPDGRHGRRDQADGRARGHNLARTRRRRSTSCPSTSSRWAA